jgi:hypothetical protein
MVKSENKQKTPKGYENEENLRKLSFSLWATACY